MEESIKIKIEAKKKKASLFKSNLYDSEIMLDDSEDVGEGEEVEENQ